MDDDLKRRKKLEEMSPSAQIYGQRPEPGIREEGFTDILNQIPGGQYIWSFLPGGGLEQKAAEIGEATGLTKKAEDFGRLTGLLERGRTPRPSALAEPMAEQPKALEGLLQDHPSSPGPNQTIRQAAQDYSQQAGLNYNPPTTYLKANPEDSAKIAQAYHEMIHDPYHPEVQKSYDALTNETLAQYQKLKDMGLKVDPIKGNENPYKNSKQMMDDVRNNNHLYFFPTDEGFGSSSFDASAHPLMKETNEKVGDKNLKVNDIFRIVHDVFGHAKEGVGFGPNGEENAWAHHMNMYSPEAQKAMTTETRGQNSWVNFGPFGETNRAYPADTTYADQKAGILPDWVLKKDN